MKKYINIHLEAMDDDGEKLRRIFDENIPCAISIAPETLRENGIYSHRQEYSKLSKYLDLISRIVNKNGNILGQQGNMHKCKYKHRFTDSWHENHCPWEDSLSKEEQKELMEDGKKTLEKYLGKAPELYVAPNHLDDFTTMDIACNMEYPIYAIRGIRVLKPLVHKANIYSSRHILVVPEVKINEEGYFYYIHYDEIEKNQTAFDEIAKNTGSFHEVGIVFRMAGKYFLANGKINTSELDKDYNSIEKNRAAVLRRKIWRDIKNFPGKFVGRHF